MHFTVVEVTLIVLSITLMVTVIFRAIRLPVILGYLVVGTIVGPHVLGWLPHTNDIKELAEFGIAFLMFTIGLEFSLSKLLALRYYVFVIGSLQVFLSIAIALLIGYMIGITLIESIVVGCVVAMSSTAIVFKQLSEQFEIQSQHGLNAVGILLFQDLAVIPILILIASFSSTQPITDLSNLLWPLIKGIIAIIAIILIGRWLLKPLFHLVASTHVSELFTLIVLFVAISSAWLTHITGVSYALGAFLAGIMLAETEFKHQINIEIRPFRDVLLGLFFVTVGMLVDIDTWSETWHWIALLLTGLVLGKALLIFSICYLSKRELMSSIRTGIILSQGGEFGFAILTLALSNQLLPPAYGQIVLAALLITFACAPIMIRYNEALASLITRYKNDQNKEQQINDVHTTSSTLRNHVIICGYGRVGQNISQFLKQVNYPYIGIDLDPKIIHDAKLAGDCVVYGNITQIDILKAAKLNQAASVIICVDNFHAAVSILNQIRQINKSVPIIARCKDNSEYKQLRELSATKVVAEIFEESLTLTSQLFETLNIPKSKVIKLLQETRDKNYSTLNRVFSGVLCDDASNLNDEKKYLRPISIPPYSHMINQSLSSIDIEGIEITALYREKKQLEADETTTIHAGDIIILYGNTSSLDIAEEILLS